MNTTTAKQIPISNVLHYRQRYTYKPPKEFILHTETHIEILKPERILFVKAHSNYSTFHLRNGRKLTVSKTLGSFADILLTFHFIRCHQSYLVNRNAISRIDKSKSMVLILNQEHEIPVSRRNRKMIIDMFPPTC